jgi:hypothetical protein
MAAVTTATRTGSTLPRVARTPLHGQTASRMVGLKILRNEPGREERGSHAPITTRGRVSVCSDQLPSRANLLSKQILQPWGAAFCPPVPSAIETSEHLFLSYPAVATLRALRQARDQRVLSDSRSSAFSPSPPTSSSVGRRVVNHGPLARYRNNLIFDHRDPDATASIHVLLHISMPIWPPVGSTPTSCKTMTRFPFD